MSDGTASPRDASRPWRREDFPPDPEPWWSGDDVGWEAYHRQMFDLDEGPDPFAGRATPPSAFTHWKIFSTGVTVARHLAGARNRGRVDWVSRYGEDSGGWPLPHPPAVLWVPESARAACLQCCWLGRSAGDRDSAALQARDHAAATVAVARVPEDAAELLAAPVGVWARDARTDEPVPPTAG